MFKQRLTFCYPFALLLVSVFPDNYRIVLEQTITPSNCYYSPFPPKIFLFNQSRATRIKELEYFNLLV